ncbi:hypothetical protein FISHEDRAFT_74808 [Fistulina hepatica ATCC 64428]|uniref:Heterokaryon incompatibility domain-containing protein n=1 Tax=Fistulina hepatica ATCC 64428 TaxID=1128425 RepID=A0A0D7A8E3_9AGAR|nr:hypothetical protein FISHEDRAFT_74808 [Fistulina hepatica ATCC 64428]
MSLFLLIPISEILDGNLAPYLELRGQRWAVKEFQVSHGPNEGNRSIPAYTCISYVWGSGRTPNSMYAGVEMSDRTLPALLTAMEVCSSIAMEKCSSTVTENCSSAAYWIDAFCIPSGQKDPEGKRATLQSMGYIYSRAQRVVCVISSTSFKALQELSSLDSLQMKEPNLMKQPETKKRQKSLLKTMDKDPWVRSVWTYQEVANSSELLISGEGLAQTKPLLAYDFLNRLGEFIVRYCRAHETSMHIFYGKYPYISRFEDLMLDWYTADPTTRTAYQVMSAMEKRHWDKDANFFYSSIGALTQDLVERTPASSIEALAESFMSMCENKHDFSFIFASGIRDPRDGLRWRPAPQILRSVLPWPSHGAQGGHRTAHGAVLKDMVLLPGASGISAYARAAILSFLDVEDAPELTDARIARLCSDTLSGFGFRGDKEHVMITTNGVFFAQDASAIRSCPNAELWVSSTFRWPFGCFGLAVLPDGEKTKCYAPAVFMGPINKIAEGEDPLKQDLLLD